jgi:hypothetical protein
VAALSVSALVSAISAAATVLRSIQIPSVAVPTRRMKTTRCLFCLLETLSCGRASPLAGGARITHSGSNQTRILANSDVKYQTLIWAMSFAVLIIGAVLSGSVILVELAFEFRRARSFDGEPDRPKQRRTPNSLMTTKKVPRERNPFLLTGKRRWRPISLDLT